MLEMWTTWSLKTAQQVLSGPVFPWKFTVIHGTSECAAAPCRTRWKRCCVPLAEDALPSLAFLASSLTRRSRTSARNAARPSARSAAWTSTRGRTPGRSLSSAMWVSPCSLVTRDGRRVRGACPCGPSRLCEWGGECVHALHSASLFMSCAPYTFWLHNLYVFHPSLLAAHDLSFSLRHTCTQF